MARWRAVIMGLLVLIVTGCINQSTDKTSDGTSPYKVFTQNIQSENMQKYGIYYREDDILEEGSTRFVYNGSKYVVSGTYYDYQTRGEAIGKEAQ